MDIARICHISSKLTLKEAENAEEKAKEHKKEQKLFRKVSSKRDL